MAIKTKSNSGGSTAQASLETYNRKRKFNETPEPRGAAAKPHKEPIFVIQKHDATRLHYDLRLELDGTMKSWAVPNGPSLDPADKRLAIRTEDHPLSYATFEGTIPKGEYGGGTVMLWDRGIWWPVPGKDPRQSLKKGHLHFFVDGERMKGEWILIRLRPRPGEKKENWMLRKIEDEHVGNPTGLTDHYLTSIKTGRTMQEIAAGKKAKMLASWSKMPKPSAREGSRTRTASKKASGRGAAMPKFREPQKATLVDHVPTGSGWIHEMKYDGYRCLLAIGGGKAKIYTRKGLDWTDKFPEIADAARKLTAGSALLDGEIVRLAEGGNTSFSALQHAISEGGRGLSLFLFDALEMDGENLAPLSTVERKARLAGLIGPGRPPHIL